MSSRTEKDFQERKARYLAYMDALHETAEEMGLNHALVAASMTAEERLWAEIAHYDRIIEQASSGESGQMGA